MAARAFSEGVERMSTKGALRRYLDGHFINSRAPIFLRVFAESVFIFGLDGTFVTTWRLPSELRRRLRARHREIAE